MTTDRKYYHYKYVCEDPCGVERTREFKSDCEPVWRHLLAEEAARDYHFRWGWEDSSDFPDSFTILLPDGTLLGKFEVERRVEPVFSAREIKG